MDYYSAQPVKELSLLSAIADAYDTAPYCGHVDVAD